MNRAEQEAEMRRERPHMFTHSGCKPGEVWFDDQPFESAQISTHLLQTQGECPSARLGTKKVKVFTRAGGASRACDGRSIFVGLDELIAAIEKGKMKCP